MEDVDHEEAMKSSDLEKLMKYLEANVSRDSGTIKKMFKNAIKTKNFTAIQCLIESGVSVNLPLNASQLSPLHFAIQKVYLDIVELLLEHQANIHDVNIHGLTALHYASGISGILWDVLESGFPFRIRNIQLLREEVNGIQNRSLQIFRLLLERGCEVNAKDNNGFTPLYNVFYDATRRYIPARFGSVWQNEEVAEIRRNKSKFIDQIRETQREKLKLLLASGADVKVRFGETQDTILHVIIRDLRDSRNFEQFEYPCFVDESHEEMIKDILNLKLIDVSVKNNKDETPINMAVPILSAGIVKILVDHGADLSSVKIDRFVYPKAPPCLEAVENLIDIVAMRRCQGFPLSSNETLAVLEFFIDASFATGNYFEDIFREFLEFGTEDVVIKTLEEIIAKIPEYSDFVVFFIAYESNVYLSKMYACGLHVSSKVESYLKNIISRVSRRILLTDQVFVYLDKINAEGPKVKSLKMANNKSLLEILNLPLNEIYSFIKNYEYKESIRTNFYSTSGIIKGFFARCLIRRFAVEIASDNLRFVSSTPLPDSCCYRVSKYLNNWDLLNLFKATIP